LEIVESSLILARSSRDSLEAFVVTFDDRDVANLLLDTFDTFSADDDDTFAFEDFDPAIALVDRDANNSSDTCDASSAGPVVVALT